MLKSHGAPRAASARELLDIGARFAASSPGRQKRNANRNTSASSGSAISAQRPSVLSRALEEKKTHDTWQQGLLQIFEAVRQNKPFILNVYRCVDREQVERYLRPLVDHLILGVIDEQSAAMTVRDEDKAFIAQVYGYIFIGIMLDWIRDGMTEEPEKIVDRLALLIHDSIREALARFKI